jgi:hypothetical protein
MGNILGVICVTYKGEQGHLVLLNQMAQHKVAAHLGSSI